MIRNLLTGSLVTAALLFSGCGDSEGEDRLEAQQMLDKGDYTGLIQNLESSDSLTDEENIALATAYMGKAGLSFSDLIVIISDSSEDEDDGSDSDGFASFVTKISDNNSSTALRDLGKSVESYENVVGDICGDNEQNSTITNTIKDICLFTGLVQTMRAATSISYLTDNIANFGSGNDTKLQASTCAMQYASGLSVDSECTTTSAGTVTFSVTEKTYNGLEVIVNGTSYDYLITTNEPINNTIITDGYCTNSDFSTRSDEEFAGSYICPINEVKGEEELTTLSVLVDAINGGTDSIASAFASEESDISEDIEEFKVEIKDGGSGDITTEDIIAYLNSNND